MSEETPLHVAEPVKLEYAPPVGRSRATTLLLGIIASVIYAVSGGLFVYGVMLIGRGGREAPEFVASGVTGVILATGLLVTAWIVRR